MPTSMRIRFSPTPALLALSLLILSPLRMVAQDPAPVDLATPAPAKPAPAVIAADPAEPDSSAATQPAAVKPISLPQAAEATSVSPLGTGAAITLGLVEGVTEFLPISSTGHLIIANELLGLESDTQLTDASGKPLYHKKPSAENPAGVPLTVKLAADTYTVIIQVGAILAVALLYWQQILSLFKGLLGRDREGLLLLRNLLCAVIPVGIIGLACAKWIDAHLFSIQAVIVAQISGAVLMIYAERWRRERSATHASAKSTTDLSAPESLGIGAMQCLALWPGTSRSMVTIVGGYFMGLNPARAAEFSFLVGLPVLAGAALLKGLKSGPSMIAVFGWDHVLLGIVIAAISAAVAVKFLVAFLTRFGLFAFAIYRLALAAVLAAWFFV